MKCKTCKSPCAWAGKEESEHGKCLVGYTPITNADRIRAKSDDEMARWLALHPCLPNCPAQNDECFKSSKLENCKKQWLNWLRQETEAGEL